MAPCSEAGILVAGVGHPLMGDDALGFEVIQALEAGPLPERVRLFYAGASPLDLLGELAGIRMLIIVDAVTGVAHGEIIKKRIAHHVTDSYMNEAGTHGIGLVQTLRMAQELHPDLAIVLIGAGIEPSATPGTPLHSTLRQALPALLETIKEEITAALVCNLKQEHR